MAKLTQKRTREESILLGSVAEVLLTKFPESKTLVSGIIPGSAGTRFTSRPFEDTHIPELLDAIKSTSPTVIAILSSYNPLPRNESSQNDSIVITENADGNGDMPQSNGDSDNEIEDEGLIISVARKTCNPKTDEDERCCYLGSGLLILVKGKYYVLTARHNILPTLKSSKEISNDDLTLDEINVALPQHLDDVDLWHKAQNIECLRKREFPHNIENDIKWKYPSDFAILHLPKGNEHNLFKVNEFQFNIQPPRNGGIVFLFGIPGLLVSDQWSANQEENGFSYGDYLKTFKPEKLNVSRGRITVARDSLCSYDANSSYGMSGGPVFRALKNGNNLQLLLIGIHVGGTSSASLNYFIPLSMNEISSAINSLNEE